MDWALQVVDMAEHAKGTHTRLSGGQKQRVAIACVLALKPKVIVLDESTSMLDPKGRDEVLKVVQQLNRQFGITVVMITHFMQEAHLADRIIILSKGKVVLDGGKEIYQQRQILEQAGLELPPFAFVANELNLKDVHCEDDLIHSLKDKLKDEGKVGRSDSNFKDEEPAIATAPAVVSSKALKFTYSPKTSFAKVAIDNVDIHVYEGDFLGIIGHTGSGKTTFIGHLNALVKLQQGQLTVCGIDLSKKFKANNLRSQVGMVFQYPEYQLFDETVAKDIAFGPKNLGLSAEEISQRVKESIRLVGLDYDSIASKSPFELSGGQKRRVALAGVIAMRPKILVLDEPTAGLDPQGKTEILDLISSIKCFCPTVIMISHNMDEIAQYCNRVALFSNSKLLQVSHPTKLFSQVELLQSLRLDIPSTTRIVNRLNAQGANVPTDILDLKTLTNTLQSKLNKTVS